MLPSPSSLRSAMPEAAPGCSGFPEWILLEKLGRIGRCNDATTARSVTGEHGPIEVSVVVANPPALSRCVVHCADLTAADDDWIPPCVTGADGAFLLLAVSFCDPFDGHAIRKVFVYRAGPGTPSLLLLPEPNNEFINISSNNVGVLSCGDHCLVVIPEQHYIRADDWMRCDLHIFSTETKLWSTKVACDLVQIHIDFEHTKVFRVGGDSLAWVDLRHGILLCDNVLGEYPVMRMIQLPRLMPINNTVDFKPRLDMVRDVIFRDGWFRFIEMEPQYSDCSKASQLQWTVTMYKRMIHSDKWEPCANVDSAYLTPANSCFSDFFPELWESREKKLTLHKLICSEPTLDQYHDDVVYMVSELHPDDPHGWLLVINTESKKLERAVPIAAEYFHIPCTFLQCSFSKYFSKAPGARMTRAQEIRTNRKKVELVEACLLSALDQLKNIDMHMESLTRRYTGCMPLPSSGATSSFDPNILRETEHRLNNLRCKYVAPPLNEWLRVVRDIELHLSSPIYETKNKIRAAYAALYNLMQTLPSDVLDQEFVSSPGCLN